MAAGLLFVFDVSRSLLSASDGFLLQMLPTTLIPRNDLLSERNLYLASIGILLVSVLLGSG